MKLVYTELEQQLVFQENKVNVLVVEHKELFRRMINALNDQLEGVEKGFTLSADNKILKIEKELCLVLNPFALEINARKALTGLYNELSKLGLNEENYVKTLNFTQGKEILKIDLPSKRQETIEEIINTKSNVDDKSSYLSPSYLTTYIDCPLEFYYKNICRLKVLEQEEDKIPLAFGTLFHNSAQLLEESKHDKMPQVCVMEAFDAMGEEKDLLKEVHKSMITSYLQDLSAYDKKNTDRQFHAAEKEVS